MPMIRDVSGISLPNPIPHLLYTPSNTNETSVQVCGCLALTQVSSHSPSSNGHGSSKTFELQCLRKSHRHWRSHRLNYSHSELIRLPFLWGQWWNELEAMLSNTWALVHWKHCSPPSDLVLCPITHLQKAVASTWDDLPWETMAYKLSLT